MKTDEDGIPRRNRLDLNTSAEIAIREAVAAVEDAGAHPLLTEAVVLLAQAREKVADFVDMTEWRELMQAVCTACNFLEHPEDSDSYRAAAKAASIALLDTSKLYYESLQRS